MNCIILKTKTNNTNPNTSTPTNMSSFANEMIECCICMECITTTNKTTTECGHTFHSSCIFRNLSERIECPMCRKELIEAPEDESEYNSDDDNESEYDSDADSVLSINSYQFQSEDLEDFGASISVSTNERYNEFKKYSHKRDTDPVISYEQIANKMMALGVTPADMMALYCIKIAEIHTETTEDVAKYSPKKIHELDILYRKIARGEIAVNYRDQRTYAGVLQQSNATSGNKPGNEN